MRFIALALLTAALVQSQTRVRLTNGDIRPAKLILAPKVKTPPAAKAARIRGVVKLAIEIDEVGRVASVWLVSGHPLLVSAAMDAAKRRRYRPATARGKPIREMAPLELAFRTEYPPLEMAPLARR